jgi:hypothetical protein
MVHCCNFFFIRCRSAPPHRMAPGAVRTPAPLSNFRNLTLSFVSVVIFSLVLIHSGVLGRLQQGAKLRNCRLAFKYELCNIQYIWPGFRWAEAAPADEGEIFRKCKDQKVLFKHSVRWSAAEGEIFLKYKVIKSDF